MRAGRRLYRMALWALPPASRRAVGADMEDTFLRLVDRAGRRGRTCAAALVVREVMDVLAVGLGERASAAWASWPVVRPALRRVGRRPTHAFAVVGTLALGLGASAAMFAVVRTVVLHPLPFSDPERLVHVWRHVVEPENTVPGVSNRSFLAWRELRADVFTDVEGFHRDTRVLTGAGAPEQIRVAVVTPGLLDLLGIPPVMGRGFESGEGLPGDDAMVVVGHELWVRRFGADPGLIGRTIELDGRDYTVVGVMPTAFRFPERDTQAWLPVAPVPSALTPGDGPPAVPGVDVLARMRPGLDRESANAALRQRMDELVAAGADPGEYPEVYDLGFFTTPQRTRHMLLLLFGAVILVLLIATANVVSLAVSQALRQKDELAVRRALGAGRGRIFGELLAENLVLTASGAGLGLLVAQGVLATLVPLVPDQLGIRTWGEPLTVWPGALPFALLVALLVAPVMTALARLPGTGALTPRGMGRISGPRGGLRVQQALIAGQMALAVLLLAGGVLVGGSVLRLTHVDTGMDVDRLLAVSLRIPTAMMLGRAAEPPATRERAALFDARFQEFHAALRRVPGVVSVASTTSPLPLTRAQFRPELETPGKAPLSPTDFLPMSEVTEGFFRTAGIRILEGRPFTAGDDPASTVVVNETVARRLWPEGGAVGRAMRASSHQPWRTVVGVAAPTAQMSLRDEWGRGAEIYLPLDRSRFGVYRTFLLRTDGRDPGALAPAVREAVWAVDPVQPIERLLPLQQAYADSIGRERFVLWLLGIYALLAVLLAAGGVYAVVAASLSRRTRELGVRVALGAGPPRVLARVVRGGLGPAAAGIAVGLAGAWPLSRLLRGLLFGVEPGDPASLALTAALLGMVAALACVPAARRALTADPVEALRSE